MSIISGVLSRMDAHLIRSTESINEHHIWSSFMHGCASYQEHWVHYCASYLEFFHAWMRILSGALSPLLRIISGVLSCMDAYLIRSTESITEHLARRIDWPEWWGHQCIPQWIPPCVRHRAKMPPILSAWHQNKDEWHQNKMTSEHRRGHDIRAKMCVCHQNRDECMSSGQSWAHDIMTKMSAWHQDQDESVTSDKDECVTS